MIERSHSQSGPRYYPLSKRINNLKEHILHPTPSTLPQYQQADLTRCALIYGSKCTISHYLFLLQTGRAAKGYNKLINANPPPPDGPSEHLYRKVCSDIGIQVMPSHFLLVRQYAGFPRCAFVDVEFQMVPSPFLRYCKQADGKGRTDIGVRMLHLLQSSFPCFNQPVRCCNVRLRAHSHGHTSGALSI